MAITILITGATGNVGSEIIKQLQKEDVHIRAGVRNREKAKNMNWQDVDIVDFNYEKPATFEKAAKGADIVFVVAPPVRNDNDKLIIPFIDSVRKSGVKYIVNLAAMGVEHSDNPMRRIEQHIERSGIPHTFLRPNWYMQNFATFEADSIINGDSINLPAGDAKTSFFDIRDVASTAVKALMENGHQNRVLVLTGSESLDHYQVADLIGKACGRKIKYNPVSEDDTRNWLKQQGWPEENISGMLGLYAIVRAGYTAPVTNDFKNFMGREPITFEKFTRDYASRWQQKPETVKKG